MATAVVATYFESEKRLALGMAGHPNPLLFRSSENRWHKIDEQVADNEKRLLNIPIGIDECSAYPTRNIRVEDGDMFLLYSDAFTESLNQSGSYLGISGLLEVLNDNHGVPHQDIIPTLTSRIRSLNPDNLNGDDATLILGHFTKAESNQTLKRELLTAS
jgi:serine phosphatase RsbU (regulator of sigma subunit)